MKKKVFLTMKNKVFLTMKNKAFFTMKKKAFITMNRRCEPRRAVAVSKTSQGRTEYSCNTFEETLDSTRGTPTSLYRTRKGSHAPSGCATCGACVELETSTCACATAVRSCVWFNKKQRIDPKSLRGCMGDESYATYFFPAIISCFRRHEDGTIIL